MGTVNYNASSNNMKLVYWPLMSKLLHLVQRGENWAGPQPAQASPKLVVPNVTTHPPTTTVPITVLLYNGLLFCGFNVPIKGLKTSAISGSRFGLSKCLISSCS